MGIYLFHGLLERDFKGILLQISHLGPSGGCTVKIKKNLLLSVIAGLAFDGAIQAQPIPTPVNPLANSQANVVSLGNIDQHLANQIANRLKEKASLVDYRIDIRVSRGKAEISGMVGSNGQKESALLVAGQTEGIIQVVDGLQVASQNPGAASIQSAPGGLPAAVSRGPNYYAAPGNRPMSNQIPEPIAVSSGATPYSYDMNPPKMPPYAWPTYAPYNNYSRVGYPEAYPANAWPFIGPVYPFPKVPLGWRSVKLEWDDGHWWFSQTSTKKDLWRLRYW
ncbi:MAG: BON domain-containing protein [Gemmataceae bacterium]|nr:BON domain-containing protein [Gemmataceae bacterium]